MAQVENDFAPMSRREEETKSIYNFRHIFGMQTIKYGNWWAHLHDVKATEESKSNQGSCYRILSLHIIY